MRQVYENGSILTMENGGYARRVAVENGRIAAVGEVDADFSRTAEHIDLKGRAMLPAFCDSHSHITALAETRGLCDLSSAENTQDIVALLRGFRRSRGLRGGEWIVGFGYDHNNFPGKAHPDREALDALENPVLIANASGHMGVANSAGLERLGIFADTLDPEGGRIGREGGALNGYLEEAAFFLASARIPKPGMEERLKLLEEAQRIYLENGIATIQDGLTGREGLELLKAAAKRGILRADVVAYLDYRDLPQDPPSPAYARGLRVGGWKILLDGSPQGRTAYLSRPYEGEREYRGYPVYENARVGEIFRRALREGVQLLAHCNGDAAAEQFISAAESAEKTEDVRRVRPVMIHAQTVTPSQLARMGRIGMIASFFAAHTYYWGDAHVVNLGDRAETISPAKAAADAGVAYTLHQDTPVLPPDMLRTVWCAVNRLTRSGRELGKEQKITVTDALKGITINAAYQYFEEGEKGSIAPGKRADFVIMDADPLSVPPEEIAQIRVLATVKDGVTLYRR